MRPKRAVRFAVCTRMRVHPYAQLCRCWVLVLQCTRRDACGSAGVTAGGVDACLEGCDALGGVVLEHTLEEVFELEVIDERVAGLVGAAPARATCLHAE